jgi:hypothetical protein
MPNIHDLKKSKFLTKADVEPAVLATISGYEQVNVAVEGAEADMKWALTFNELEKPFICNSTNGQIIASITKSEDFDAWIGAKVVLYNEPNISFGGRLTGGIRVRAPRGQAAKPAPAPAKPAAKPVPASAKPDPYDAQPEAPDDGDPSVPF